MPYKNIEEQRKAQAEWYQKNKDAIRTKRKKLKAEARKWVTNYKTKHSTCADCKNNFPPHILDFDHLGDKSFGISRAIQIGTSLDKIIEEVNKCEIVCANCHRDRTYSRSRNANVA